jgi:hypothetical protein
MHNLSTFFVIKSSWILWASCGSTVDSLCMSHIVDFKALYMYETLCTGNLILSNLDALF